MLAAVYCRCRTDHVAVQRLKELRDYCDEMGWEIVAEYRDNRHGRRYQLTKLIDAVERREVEAVAFWSVNDISRNDARAVLALLGWLGERARWVTVSDHFADWCLRG